MVIGLCTKCVMLGYTVQHSLYQVFTEMSIRDLLLLSGIGIDINTLGLLYQSLTSDLSFKVGVGINYWDDPEGLIRILTNDIVYDYVDKFFVIDGRYEGRKDEAQSHPAYLQDLQDIYSKLEVYTMDDTKQIDKRNRYWALAQINKMDYMIVLDSDEYMEIEPDILNRTLRTIQDRDAKCYPIIQYMKEVVEMKKPRMFKAPFTFRHFQNKTENISHGSLYDEDGKEVIAQMFAWYQDHPKRTGIPGIKMWHDKTYRSRDRVISDRVYYDEVKDR